MMLETDMALVKDKAFRPIAEKYAKDEGAFFKDFSAAFAKASAGSCADVTDPCS